MHAANCVVLTDLLTFHVLDEVQQLAGHAEPRTTGGIRLAFVSFNFIYLLYHGKLRHSLSWTL